MSTRRKSSPPETYPTKQQAEARKRLALDWRMSPAQALRMIDEQRAVCSQLSRVPRGSGYTIGP